MMIPTRALFQVAAAEHHTPLIRFLGKRSPTSMFNRRPPPAPPFSRLRSSSSTSLSKYIISNHWYATCSHKNPPTQPPMHILPHPLTPSPTHLSNTDPKRKTTDPSAVIVPAPPPPPPLLHHHHLHHQHHHLCHIMAPLVGIRASRLGV